MTPELYLDSRLSHNTARDPALVRLSGDHRRLLGCDPAALVWQADRARTWLAGGVVPITLRVEAHREVETLTSTVIAQLGRLDLPVIILFERGPPAVRHWVNIPVFTTRERS
jgi:hypothetical protein